VKPLTTEWSASTEHREINNSHVSFNIPCTHVPYAYLRFAKVDLQFERIDTRFDKVDVQFQLMRTMFKEELLEFKESLRKDMSDFRESMRKDMFKFAGFLTVSVLSAISIFGTFVR
jgi:hypothetical protein